MFDIIESSEKSLDLGWNWTRISRVPVWIVDHLAIEHEQLLDLI